MSFEAHRKRPSRRPARRMAERLRTDGVSAPAVGIVVNRVDLARGIFNNLREEGGSTAVLLIGRSRGVGRDQIIETLAPFRTGVSRTPDTSRPAAAAAGDQELHPETLDNTLFVVATQCLEVGVDLDLDGLVTQAAALDALRQRFGRLNRAGRRVPAAGAILARAEEIVKKADDPVYGDRLMKTWEALTRMAHKNEVDFGIAAFETRRQECAIEVEALARAQGDGSGAYAGLPRSLVADLAAAGCRPGRRVVPTWGRSHIRRRVHCLA